MDNDPCCSILFDTPRQEYSERFYMQRQKIESWVKDDNVNNCTECNSSFGLLLRKHHCRACGRIFCYQCTNYQIKLPREFETFPNIPEPSITNIVKNWVTGNQETLDRVCQKCYLKYNKMKHIYCLVRILSHGYLTLPDWGALGIVNQDWKSASIYVFSNFRRMQYNLYRHTYTQQEFNILWCNRYFFTGHCRWLGQLLHCVSSFNYKQISGSKKKHILEKNQKLVQEVVYLCSEQATVDCNYLLCSRSCTNIFQIEQLVNLLSIPYDSVQNFVMDQLEHIPIEEILHFFPLLLKSLSFQKNNRLITFLINKSDNLPFLTSYYWNLVFFYSHVKEKLDSGIYKLQNSDNKKIRQLTLNIRKGHQLLNVISHTCLSERSDKVNLFQQLLKKHNIVLSDINYPFFINKSYQKVFIDQITRKKSASAPFVIPVKLNDMSTQYFLLKHDDLRKDALIISCMKIAKFFLMRELQDDYNLVIYDVIALTPDYGYIQIIPEAKTIYEITKKSSLLNYILDQNSNDTVDILRTRFMKSTAVYCVLTYLFGIGDRHLNNIMITKRGELFHIDYSFILGRDPKPIAPHLRLTSEMIDMLGGKNSNFYQQFQEHCFKIFLCLKRYANVFLEALSVICNLEISNNISFNILQKEIIDRFLPGFSEQEAREHFRKTIQNSQNYNSLFYQLLYHPDKRLF